MKIGTGIREGNELKFPTHLGTKKCKLSQVESVFDSVLPKNEFEYSVRVTGDPKYGYHVYGITEKTANFLLAVTGLKHNSTEEEIKKNRKRRIDQEALRFNKKWNAIEVRWKIKETIHETDKARLVQVSDNYGTKGQVWVPKSVIINDRIKSWFHKIITNRVGTNGQFQR